MFILFYYKLYYRQHNNLSENFNWKHSMNVIMFLMVYPKMKIVNLLTHPEVFQTCMSLFLLLNTKEDILKNVGN